MGWRRGPNKYGAVRVQCAGRSFASAGEATCYQYLLALQQAGEIRDIETQVTVYLTDARVEMRPDYRFYHLPSKRIIYAEYKGFETDAWRIKRRLWTVYGPGPLWVYKGRGARITLVETIEPSQGKT